MSSSRPLSGASKKRPISSTVDTLKEIEEENFKKARSVVTSSSGNAKNEADGEFKLLPAEKAKRFPNEPDDSILNQFKQGDLVFGLLKPRNEVVAKLEAAGCHHMTANTLNMPTVKLIVDKVENTDKLDAPQKKHYNFLKKREKYLLFKPGKTLPSMPDEPELGAAIRRSCKLLLVNHEQDRPTVHVVTQKIDWEHVFVNGKKDCGITDSEMRACYRDFKEHGRHPNILFYNAENRLQSKLPWEEDPKVKQYCEEYDKQRSLKNK